MCKLSKNILIYCLCFFCGLIAVFRNVSAEVFTEKASNGYSEAVYVAGNSDMYPIEYYDKKNDCYKGIIPDILKNISEKTGIDFVYVYAGKEHIRERLSKNKQVEMVTAFSDDTEYNLEKNIPVISYEANGEKKTYYIGFTEIINAEKEEKIISALSDITENQKNGLLISNTEKPRYDYKDVAIIVSVIFLSIDAVIVLCVVLFFKKRKKTFNQDDYIDELTGVGNGDYYNYAFDNLISEQAKNLYSVAYFAFDVEKAEKQFDKNAVPDIEKYAASKLNTYVGAGEYISRVQRGVFVVLFQGENEKKCLERVIQTVQGVNKYLSEFNTDWKNLFKVGVCRLCDHTGNNAETAFYNAKQGYLYAVSKGLDCHIGSKTQLAQSRKTDELRESVNEAIKNGEFKIYMQLIVDSRTDKFCGAEVLSRWQNGKYGLLRPYEYMEILKETEKIVEHDYNVFEQICKILEQWNVEPYINMFLTCNFTRLSVEKNNFVKKLDEISRKYNFSHERLVIEITEDTLNSDSENLSKNIAACKNMGFKVAIDDMGAGFSSLADIYDNEIDIVKIDRNFISSCINERRQKMLGDLITLVHNANAKVISEGIENEKQAEMLKGLNSDMMQGFYYARVLPLSECKRIIDSE